MADIFSTIINAITSAAKKNASQAGVPGQTADTSKSANAATPASALTPTSTGLYNPFPTGGPILAGGPGTAQALANQVSSIVATPGLDMAMPQGGAGQGASPIAPKAQQAIDPQLASSPQFSHCLMRLTVRQVTRCKGNCNDENVAFQE